MNNIDYKLFVPRGSLNYLRIKEKEFLVEEILTLNIHFSDQKINYWFDIRIPFEEKDYVVFVKKNKFFPAVLLIGNNPFEIIGEAEIFSIGQNIPKGYEEITILFRSNNLNEIYNHPRVEKQKTRGQLLDLED